jgi:hypothetical protein
MNNALMLEEDPYRVGYQILPGAGGLNAVAIAYMVDSTPLEQDIPLTATPTVPNVAAAYDVDIASMNAHAAYIASQGTIRFTSACAEGASGTLTDVVLVEATVDLTSPIPSGGVVPGGCTITVPSPTTFSFGAACP